MQRLLPVLLLGLLWAGPARSQGLLVPTDARLTPLAMLRHRVTIAIEDQVAVTRVVQTFRNDTDRPLEANYVFPVPKGASVKKFTMWVGCKEVSGELVEADKARAVYTEIVRRTQDPGLLEYLGNNLLRVRVFPVPAHGDQKLSLSYTSVAACDSGLVEYVYPLRTDGKAAQTLKDFRIEATIKSQHPVQNVYSPTHAITVKRPGDRAAHVSFQEKQAVLDKDFRLYYTPGDLDVGLTALPYRVVKGADGYFMLLISPRAELSRKQRVARDMVLVLDTSGSMSGVKMEQARKALKFCLDRLTSKDRFALINFATTVNRYHPGLTRVTPAAIEQAKHWVDRLEATGGTAIDEALASALEMRSPDSGRSFTVVFFTDGEPTVGETDPQKILKTVADKNTTNTRIFTFGVGDDVNTVLLDKLADQTRAVSTYVRPVEDIEVKVSSLYAKISHPVLTNLKLKAGKNVHLTEVYPAQLPDLFHGSQLVVLGRYHGKGHTAVTLTGRVGKQKVEFVYEANFPAQTKDDKSFVEDLWARRKVGYLLDQIRTNGAKKELVDEVVTLAKKHGITTPYTSYLVVPDGTPPVTPSTLTTQQVPQSVPYGATYGGPGVEAGGGSQRIQFAPVTSAPAMQWAVPNSVLNGPPAGQPMSAPPAMAVPSVAVPGVTVNSSTQPAATPGSSGGGVGVFFNLPANAQTGKEGVDLSVVLNNLRNQDQTGQTTSRQAAGRNCLQVGGAWVDEGYTNKMKVLTVKAQSKAYFRILERHPEIKEVFRLGNQVVWVTPSNVVLVIDVKNGKDRLSDAEIDHLFVVKK